MQDVIWTLGTYVRVPLLDQENFYRSDVLVPFPVADSPADEPVEQLLQVDVDRQRLFAHLYSTVKSFTKIKNFRMKVKFDNLTYVSLCTYSQKSYNIYRKALKS